LRPALVEGHAWRAHSASSLVHQLLVIVGLHQVGIGQRAQHRLGERGALRRRASCCSTSIACLVIALHRRLCPAFPQTLHVFGCQLLLRISLRSWEGLSNLLRRPQALQSTRKRLSGRSRLVLSSVVELQLVLDDHVGHSLWDHSEALIPRVGTISGSRNE